MADILIRGMEMPESCDKCRLFNECWCMALGIEHWRKSYNKPPEGERLSDCPLVPLPAGHGRLGDLDALLEKGMKLSWSVQKWVQEVDIVTAPTIVPAEGGMNDV